MAIKQPDQAALTHCLPHIRMALFDVDQSPEYQYWKSDDASWQLRCIGGPGSGKVGGLYPKLSNVTLTYHLAPQTTLSCLIIEDLESSFKGPKTAIISIFLQPLSDHAVNGSLYPLSTEFLLEIQRQLKTSLGESDDDKPDAAQDKLISNGDDAKYEWVRFRIQPLDRVFLVIDDLDLAFRDAVQYRELESQLSRLQSVDFKILTTSRLPYKTGELRRCDVETHTGPAFLRFWWHCEACGLGVYDIRQECKDAGNGCNKADHAELPLTQQPSKVQVYVSHFFLPEGLSVLVRDAMQREHGDLGLDTSAQTPRACGIKRFLGLQSIRIVGRFIEQIEIPYEELKEELREACKGDESELDGILGSEDALEQILFAARGFLTSRKIWNSIWVKCYQVDFHLYVAENYSDILSQLE
ncbi:hypothetical protein PG994_013319 [Apiospora phragmitis]|uniref:Uncharacterized protein n=1 Tax=Apiospora phragmitis TaxID=2905665 RepID=A0ABR1T8B1_9PEZI